MTFSNKLRKSVDFGFVFGVQNYEKSKENDVEKHCFFEQLILSVFFRDLTDFGLILGGSGPPKNC